MRFLFLNQYTPPDPAPTARLLGELADHLRAQGHEVETVSQSQDYHGRPSGGRGRARRELSALLTIFRAGWRATRRKPDLILALSSPPGLLVVAAILARLRRLPLAHWAMDLYPELALALGEVGEGSAAYRALRVAMWWTYRRAALIVALDEDMQTHLRATYGVAAEVLAPWPARSFEQQTAAALARDQPSAAPWTWLYSGNLGRAHEWVTLLETQHLLEARDLPIRLVFQGDGAARRLAIACARTLGLQRCEWKGYAEKENLAASLLAAQLLVVTQRPETRGLLWPSKLAALETLPRPVLFIGPTDGAIARRLRARGHTGIFAPGDAENAARWVEEQFRQPTQTWAAGQLPPSGADGCALLERWLTACVPTADQGIAP